MILEIGSSILRESVGGEIDGGDDESAIPSRRLGVGICGRSGVWHVSPDDHCCFTGTRQKAAEQARFVVTALQPEVPRTNGGRWGWTSKDKQEHGAETQVASGNACRVT